MTLPPYFEDLTDRGDRTIMLSNVDGSDRIAVAKQDGEKIVGGRFIVVSDNAQSAQEFDWEVKAVRRDGPRLAVTPQKNEIKVVGFGPYRFTNAPH